MRDRHPSVASPAVAPSKAEVLHRIAAELGSCAMRLHCVQDEISELLHLAPRPLPKSYSGLQSVDHVTQILSSLATVVNAISFDLATGTDGVLDQEANLPILREIRDRLLKAEKDRPDEHDDPEHVADWL